MQFTEFRIKTTFTLILTVYFHCIRRADLLPAPAQTILEVLEGGRAELPCPAVNTSSSSAMTLVLWQRIEPGSLQPVYTVDARRQVTLKHFPAVELKTRARFDIASAILHLERIVFTDAGLYRCRVEFRRARTRTYSVLLKVIVPPREAVIMDEFGQHLRGVIGPYDEGYPLTLACEAEGGNPSPSVTWWRHDEVLDSSFALTAQGFARNELLVPELTRQDLLINLTCRVKNSDLAPPVNSSVTLDLNLSPTEVHITSLRGPLRAGSEAEVVCVSRGARPPARVSWWLTKAKINDEGQKVVAQVTEKIIESSSRDDNLTISTLTFVPRYDDHGSELSCRADNPLMQDSTFIQDNWTLHVRYTPRVRASLSPIGPVQEGSSVTLTCQIKSNPQTTEIEWLLDGHSFEKWTEHSRNGLIDELGPHNQFDQNNLTNQLKSKLELQEVFEENRILNLTSVDPMHSGNFRCAATNSEGRSVSSALKLQVQYKPRCVSALSSSIPPGQEMVFSIGKNETISVVCAVEANPPDVQFEWTLNGSPISPVTAQPFDIVPATSKAKDKGKRRESIMVLSEPSAMAEYGLLECLAVNKMGRQREPCVFRLVPSGPPEPLQRCSVFHNVTSQCLNVECDASPSHNSKTKMEVLSDQGQLLMEVKKGHIAQPSFEACALPSGAALLLLIYAEGTDGQSSPPLAIRTNTPAYQTVSPSSGPQRDAFFIGMIAAMIIIICITVITVTVLIWVLRRRNSEQQDVTQRSDDDKVGTKENISSAQGPDIIPVKGYLREQVELQGLEKVPADDEGPSTVTLSSFDNQFCWSFTEVPNQEIRAVSVDLLLGGGGGGGGAAAGGGCSEAMISADGETPLVSSLPHCAQQWNEEGRRLSTPV